MTETSENNFLLKTIKNGRPIADDVFNQLFDQADVVSVQGYDESRRVIYWSQGSVNLYGFSAEEAMGKKIENLIIPEEMRETVISAHNEWLHNGIKIPSSKLSLCKSDGSTVYVYSSHVMYKNQYGQQQMYCIDIDLAELKRVEAQANQKETILNTVFKVIPDLCFLMDEKSTILDYYAGDEQNLYVCSDVFLGSSMHELLPEDVAVQFLENIEKVKNDGGLVTYEYNLLLPNGSRFFDARLSQVPNSDEFITIIRDITDSKQKEALILHQAHYDSLTNLPNRFLALDRLSQLVATAKRNDEKIAVLFVDLDEFKKINDTLGHETGDKSLIEAARRLKLIVRDEDTVGRVGGDEFIILLQGLTGANDVSLIVESLLKYFREPFKIDDRELLLTLSVGIAIYPDNGNSPSILLRNADAAMYQAKSLGRNTYSYFTEAMNNDLSRRLDIEEQLSGALEKNEFEVYYQPQVNVASGLIIGAEALLRWHNDKLGEVYPTEFIPIAEQTGLIVSIGQFVLKEALATLRQWQIDYDANLSMAVNLSPRQFRDPQLLSSIKRVVEQTGISAASLELEITEGVLMTGNSYVDTVLGGLRTLGIQLSMDDFGKGYSSLSYLRKYSFDVIKVDRSFIDGIANNEADKHLVKAAIAMAHSLGLKVIAEGVENEDQLYILEELKCDSVQGFLFSKPMRKNELLELPPYFYNANKNMLEK
jgi:diguanylate cyclase (GGDEF)-like protein/PAS domain S-box-containing protein